MAQEYTEWLAVNVLNEQQNVNIPETRLLDHANDFKVNYRNLSRALKVHCNVAKQYENPRTVEKENIAEVPIE